MAKQSPKALSFVYHSIRKITAPEDVEGQREIYCGHAPATSFLELEDDENVRDYLLDAEGRKRNRLTNVHREMFDTLANKPQDFSVLNGGITIVARAIEVDDKGRVAKITRASIINGSQTRGVLKDWLERLEEAGDEPYPVHVKFELVVTDDEELIAATSIARNFQNQVMPISIVGRLGQLDELNERFVKASKGELKLRTRETDLSEDFLPTEKVLQVVTALVPAELWHRKNERENPVKTYAYSAKAKCLREFQRIYEFAKRGEDSSGATVTDEERANFKKLYQFYLDVAYDAWSLYVHWKKHPGFIGTRIRKGQAVVREAGRVEDVNDGIVFPILAALSVFATYEKGKWRIAIPSGFDEKELAQHAAAAFQEIAKSHPWDMGKSKACYQYLQSFTALYKKFSARFPVS